MQRRTIAPVFLVGLVLSAGCLSAPSQTMADGNTDGIDATNATTVSTTGIGEVTVDAGLAVVSIAATTAADSADEVRGTVVDDVAAVRAALTNAGIIEDVVQTTDFNIYSKYDYSGQERELLGYRAAHAPHVGVASGRAGEVIDLAVGTGASEIRGAAFTLTDEKCAELHEGAPTRAVDSAKAGADSVASAADLTATGVYIATVGGSASPRPYPVAYAKDAARASSGSTELSPGPVTVSVTV